ncbi:hypothetical protein [Cupriavidus sp. EM10]|uniref:hypothetical protein n=1 Tax=Cupriavidus sp. EM10 TaxID=2839983 RepID=UPI001BFFDEDF|nr:hypothetical protein [Cupriavidus sp. EM10]QWE96873.1 hypothetical protein KLP38_27995 [Cupriavidus sp. EM10]
MLATQGAMVWCRRANDGSNGGGVSEGFAPDGAMAGAAPVWVADAAVLRMVSPGKAPAWPVGSPVFDVGDRPIVLRKVSTAGWNDGFAGQNKRENLCANIGGRKGIEIPLKPCFVLFATCLANVFAKKHGFPYVYKDNTDENAYHVRYIFRAS